MGHDVVGMVALPHVPRRLSRILLEKCPAQRSRCRRSPRRVAERLGIRRLGSWNVPDLLRRSAENLRRRHASRGADTDANHDRRKRDERGTRLKLSLRFRRRARRRLCLFDPTSPDTDHDGNRDEQPDASPFRVCGSNVSAITAASVKQCASHVRPPHLSPAAPWRDHFVRARAGQGVPSAPILVREPAVGVQPPLQLNHRDDPRLADLDRPHVRQHVVAEARLAQPEPRDGIKAETAPGARAAPAATSRLQERESPGFPGLSCRADERIRTADPFITSEVLYQLSYVGSAANASGVRRLGRLALEAV